MKVTIQNGDCKYMKRVISTNGTVESHLFTWDELQRELQSIALANDLLKRICFYQSEFDDTEMRQAITHTSKLYKEYCSGVRDGNTLCVDFSNGSRAEISMCRDRE